MVPGIPGPALTHGARSRYALQKRAADVRQALSGALADHLPQLTPADQPLVDLAVEVSAKLALLHEYLDRSSAGSLIDLRGRPRSCSALYISLLRQALAIFDRLGIGPAARAQLIGGLAAARRDTAAAAAQAALRAKYGG